LRQGEAAYWPVGTGIAFKADPVLLAKVNAARIANGVEPLPEDFPIRMVIE
jgi:hypothetical protein